MTDIEDAEEYRRFVLTHAWPPGTVRRLAWWERLLRWARGLVRP